MELLRLAEEEQRTGKLNLEIRRLNQRRAELDRLIAEGEERNRQVKDRGARIWEVVTNKSQENRDVRAEIMTLRERNPELARRIPIGRNIINELIRNFGSHSRRI